MGIFFEKKNKKISSTPFIILKILLIISMMTMLTLAILNDIDIFYLRIVFILLGINFAVEGMETYFQKKGQKWIGKEIGLGIMFFLIAAFLQ